MDLFFSDSLYNTKVFIVSIILTIIFFILLLTRKIYKKKLTVSNLSIYSSLFLLFIAFASLFVVNFFGKFTYVLFIAATITIIYSEISFLLGKYFFPNFVSENVSKEIYKFCGQNLQKTKENFCKDKIAKELAEISKLKVDEIFVTIVTIDFGMKGKNPVDAVTFFNKSGETVKIKREQETNMVSHNIDGAQI